MIFPTQPSNEKDRLNALKEYNILDTLPEEDYDNITRIASEICETPISLITLIDEKRQWFKSHHGLESTETPRKDAFCAHGLLNPLEALVVPNAFEDERFHDNPLVTGDPHVEFYAGIPLVSPEGFPLGSLCVIDNKPREITSEKIETLKVLAKQVVKLLELRKTVFELQETKRQLEKANSNLEEFAYVISHDIKAPLRNMKDLAEAIQEDFEDKLNEEGNQYLESMQRTANQSIEFVNGVLTYSKATHFMNPNKNDKINLNEFINKIIKQINPPENFEIIIPQNLSTIYTSSISLQQILMNLIGNAIKYNNKPQGKIEINFEEKEDRYFFTIKDNGRGIPKEKLNSIFTLFYMVDKNDEQHKGSSGVGLSIVKKLVENLDGAIHVYSEIGKNTTFEFSLKKE